MIYRYKQKGICDVMVIIGENGKMGTATRVQTLEEAVRISHSASPFAKDMNPIILPPVMD